MRDVIIVLDNIRSLYNVGSFFRTADAVGATAIYCCGITGTPKNRRLWKVSLGAEQTVAWKYYEDTMAALAQLQEQGYQVIGVELNDTSVEFTQAQYQDKVALVFGAEVEGVSATVLDVCDTVVHLPMRGHKESLNVSVVGGVMLYYLLNIKLIVIK